MKLIFMVFKNIKVKKKLLVPILSIWPFALLHKHHHTNTSSKAYTF